MWLGVSSHQLPLLLASHMVAYNIDARPPLRYNAAVKWVRNIVFAALALFALFLVLSNISTSGGGKSRLDDSPTPVNCSAHPTPSLPLVVLTCWVITDSR